MLLAVRWRVRYPRLPPPVHRAVRVLVARELLTAEPLAALRLLQTPRQLGRQLLNVPRDGRRGRGRPRRHIFPQPQRPVITVPRVLQQLLLHDHVTAAVAVVAAGAAVAAVAVAAVAAAAAVAAVAVAAVVAAVAAAAAETIFFTTAAAAVVVVVVVVVLSR